MRQRPTQRRVCVSLFSQMAWCGGGHHLSAHGPVSRTVGPIVTQTRPMCKAQKRKRNLKRKTPGRNLRLSPTNHKERKKHVTNDPQRAVLFYRKTEQKSSRATLSALVLIFELLHLTRLHQMRPQTMEILGISKPELAGHNAPLDPTVRPCASSQNPAHLG